MANDLTTHLADPVLMISSPALRKLRRISIGTVSWPNRPTRTYLPAGQSLSTEERAEAEKILVRLNAATVSDDGTDARKQRLGVVAKMLLTYPVAGASTETGKARAEAYLESLDDVPPWAVAEAVRHWHKGDCGQDYDYRWAPAPAVLRAIARGLLEPVRSMAAHVAGLLAAVPLDEAMKSGAQTAEDRAYVAEGFKKLSVDLRRGPRPDDRMDSAVMIGAEADRLAAEAAE
jgi:hypothetical protein